MAKEENEKQEEEQKEQKEQEEQKEQKEPKKSKKGFLQWAVLGVVVLIFAGAGFFAGRMIKGAGPAAANAAQNDAEEKIDDSAPDDGKTWFFKELESVVANLNDPGVMRYVRATLILEISSAAPEKETTDMFKEKAPILTNWLTIYLASLNLEDIRGDKNLKRIQAQILDAFNEEIFPDQKPKIKHVLFKEFAIQ